MYSNVKVAKMEAFKYILFLFAILCFDLFVSISKPEIK